MRRMDILEKKMGLEYFEKSGLQEIIGMPPDRWNNIIVKELIDNSLDELDKKKDEKEIRIISCYNHFAISDSGRGFSEELLDEIYDFSKYVSSKLYRKVSRGMRGNALKTIIGICYINNYHLHFVTADRGKITYIPNRERIGMRNLNNAFEKVIEETDFPKGIHIYGDFLGERLSYNVEKYIHEYRVVNPDIKFTFHGDDPPPYIMVHRNLPDIHSIHWYDLQSFAEQVASVAARYPDRTTKSFLSDYYKVKKITPGLTIPKFIGRLESQKDAHVMIKNIHDALKRNSKTVSPDFLKRYSIGNKMAKSIYGENYIKYGCGQGTYEKNGAQIPFFIEAVLSVAEDDNSIVTAINNTITYGACPLKFNIENVGFEKNFLNRALSLKGVFSLGDVIDQTGFMTGEGYKLLIQLITPYLEFYDKSKANINVEEMKGVILKVIQPLVIHALKAMKRTARSHNSLSGDISGKKIKKRSKINLMYEYFAEGARLATGDWRYPTTARQVFYAVRKLIINNHGISLNKYDSGKFTQDVLTKMFEENPDFEDKIFFEQRGVYIDPEEGGEMPISTRNVNSFLYKVNNRTECRLSLDAGAYSSSKLRIEYPLELGTTAVLFIEKQGFKEALERSGIADELGLKLILSQGYSTRNIKKMIEGFLSRGVAVYVLHDCDFDGINIKNRIIEGSKTYRKPLEAIDIGLSYRDIVEYRKLDDAEIYESQKSYENMYESMSKEEQQFFWPKKKTRKDKDGKTIYSYRRVELNAYTMPELLSHIRSKITNERPKPTPEQIRHFVNFDDNTMDTLKKDVATEILFEQVPALVRRMDDVGIALNKEAIIEEVVRAIRDGQSDAKWQDILRMNIRKHVDHIKNRMRDVIKRHQ